MPGRRFPRIAAGTNLLLEHWEKEMAYGKLTVVTGPMFSGKTEHLVKEILYRSFFNGRNPDDVVVFKPAWERRYGDDEIVSHAGARVRALAVRRSEEVWNAARPASLAVFDEVQFFTPPFFSGDFIDLIRELRGSGRDVVGAGLNMDYLGHAFEITAALMAEASELIRLTADCVHCAAPATHSARLDDAQARFEVGAEDRYAPMCANHWMAHDRRLVRKQGAA